MSITDLSTGGVTIGAVVTCGQGHQRLQAGKKSDPLPQLAGKVHDLAGREGTVTVVHVHDPVTQPPTTFAFVEFETGRVMGAWFDVSELVVVQVDDEAA